MADRTITSHLRAEAGQYKREMGEAAKATEQVASAGEKASAQATTAFGKLSKSAKDNKQAWTEAGAGLTAFGGALTGALAVTLKTGIAYNQLQQTSRAALTTLLDGASAANEQMDKLDAFARNSPFAKQTFIIAQQQLLGFGMAADKVLPTLDAIQNAVAAFGGSNQQISEISFILAQIQAAGKITAQDLMQLGQRGVDAATLIGSQMGKTGAQIRADITAGSLGAEQALDALVAGMAQRFDGAASNVKGTMAGAFDRVKAAYRDLASELAKPLVDPEGGGALIDWANGLADALRTVEKLPGPVKQGVAALTGLVGVGTLAAGAFLLLAPRIVATRAALAQLGVSSTLVSRILAVDGVVGVRSMGASLSVLTRNAMTAGAATERMAAQSAAARTNLMATGKIAGRGAALLGGLAIASTGVADSFGMTNTASMALMGTIAGPWGTAIGGAAGLLLDAKSAADNVTDAIDKMNAALESTGTNAEKAELLQDALDGVNAKLDDMSNMTGVFDTIGDSLSNALGGDWLSKLTAGGFGTSGLDKLRESAKEGEEGLKRLAEASDLTTFSFERQAQAVKDSIDAMRSKRDEALRASNAEIDYQAAILDAQEALKENGRTLDLTTRAGQDNQRKLDTLASRWNGLSDKAKNATGAFRNAKSLIIQTAEQMGMAKREAREYAERLMEIPPRVFTKMDIDGDGAISEVERIINRLKQVPKSVRTTYYVNQVNAMNKRNQGAFPIPGSNATGGLIRGPGTATSDSIPAWLSDGEFVIRASAVDRYGPEFFAALNAERFAGGGQAKDGKRKGISARDWRDLARGFDLSADMSQRDLFKEFEELAKGLRRAHVGMISSFSDLRSEALSVSSAFARTQKSIDQEKASRDSLVQAQASLVSSVTSSLTSNPFEKLANLSPWLSDEDRKALSRDSIFGTLTGDIASAGKFKDLSAVLSGAGLSGSALAAVQSQGLDALSAVAGMSAADIKKYGDLFEQRQRLVSQVAAKAGNQAYGELIKASNGVLAEARAESKRQNRRINQLEKTIERVALESARRIARDTNQTHAEVVRGKKK